VLKRANNLEEKCMLTFYYTGWAAEIDLHLIAFEETRQSIDTCGT
jgi:hypothetical protein